MALYGTIGVLDGWASTLDPAAPLQDIEFLRLRYGLDAEYCTMHVISEIAVSFAFACLYRSLKESYRRGKVPSKIARFSISFPCHPVPSSQPQRGTRRLVDSIRSEDLPTFIRLAWL